MIESFYLGLAKEMDSKLRRLAAFLNHAPSIGDYHEEVLRQVLQSMMTARFQVRTGFVFSTETGASPQQDLLIIDENHPAAYYFIEGNFVVARPEAVVCAIEVKTKLNKTTFKEAIKCLAKLRTGSQRRSIPTFIFAYEAPKFTASRLTEWYADMKEVPHDFRDYPHMIFALNQGAIKLKYITPEESGHMVIEGEERARVKLKSLSVFLQDIRKAMLMHADVPLNPYVDASMEGLNYGNHIFQYGREVPL